MPGFTIWNSGDKHADAVLSNGNLTLTGSGSTDFAGARSVASVSSGKYYWEIAFEANGSQPGVALVTADLGNIPGDNADGWGVIVGPGNGGLKMHNSVTGEYFGVDVPVGVIIGIALDMDAGKIWFSYSGVWGAYGDPEAGTGEAYSGLAGDMFAMGASYFTVPGQQTANFGASAFSYGVPSGFQSGFPAAAMTIIDLPLEVAGYGAYGAYDDDITFIAPIIEWSYQAYGHDGIALPMLTVSSETIPPNLGTAEVTLPGFSAVGGGGTPVRVSLPALTIEAIGGIGTEIRLNFPALTISAVGGGQSRFTLPILTLESTGTKGEVGSSHLVLPILSINADGVVQLIGSADLDLPMLSFAGLCHVGEVGEEETDLPMLIVEATGWPDISGILEDEDLALSVLGSGTALYRFWDYILRHER